MKRIFFLFTTACLCFLLNACITEFDPKDLESQGGVLVVDGNISLIDTTVITLMRTSPIDKAAGLSKKAITYERNATIYIVDQDGTRYGPMEGSLGEYQIDLTSLALSNDKKYAVEINTTDGYSYVSDLQQPLSSPTLDVSYVEDHEKEEVRILVNSSTIDRASNYYMWSYKEDWDYISVLPADCYFNGVRVVNTDNRTPYLNRCWSDNSSSEILLANTLKLSEDRIKDWVILTIPFRDRRITQHYSILVTQTTLDEQGFYYMENIRKNSDDIGGLFSPQPNEIVGNLHCTSHDDVAVVGYVTACNSASQRLYIECSHLPRPYEYIPADTLMPLNAGRNALNNLIDMGFLPRQMDEEQTYWNLVRCIDCQYYGGITTPPSFWPAHYPKY